MKMKLVIGSAALAGAAILVGQMSASAVERDRATSSRSKATPQTSPSLAQEADGGIAGGSIPMSIGADVIVGDLTGPSNWGGSSGIVRYSIGTTSCNQGNTALDWYDFGTASPTKHPVIPQNLYRLKDGRFEQIGQSWLKHGFCALQGTLCSNEFTFNCVPFCGGCCDELGVGCSDPYTSSRNGTPSGLGPKSQVNPATGTIVVWPFTTPQSGSTSSNNNGQIHVSVNDVNANLNPGALYYAEAMYIAQDDATAGNDNNNASHRRVTVGAAPNYGLAYSGATSRRLPAIHAWQTNDPLVVLQNVDVAGDGRFIVGYRVTDNGNGTWHYEFAVYNHNSDRAGYSFSVPLPECVNVTNVGFHDVDYHSGEPYSNTDWTSTVTADAVTWNSTQTFAQNPNANALRWSTLYNFRFDADTPPTAATGVLGLFKVVSSVNVAIQGPSAGDCGPGCVSDIAPDGGNGTVDIDDLFFIIAEWGNPGGPADIAPPGGNGVVDIDDLFQVIADWGDCL
jgi:hypothetical protein